jgi:hypothetical protein
VLKFCFWCARVLFLVCQSFVFGVLEFFLGVPRFCFVFVCPKTFVFSCARVLFLVVPEFCFRCARVLF